MSRREVYVALGQFCETDQEPIKLLKQAGLDVRLNTHGRRLRQEEMTQSVQNAEAVIAGVEPYNADVLVQLPKLRCISRCGAGTDSVDLKVAQEQGVKVLTTPNEVVQPVVELTLGMILALARNFPQHIADFRARRWKKHFGALLSEWTIGIVGLGRIGSAVAQVLKPFGCRLLAYDPQPKDFPEKSLVSFVGLEDLLKQSDLVTIHAAGQPGAPPILGREEISQMKPGSCLVNVSRGFLISEPALLQALKDGSLRAAALDVYQEEPYSGPLTQLPQVLLTPHVATLTHASRIRMELQAARNIVEFFDA